jgi:uncharacterized protein (DUF486 family)
MTLTLQTVILLALSNVFMTLAWYWHLRGLNDKPWYIAALVSWGIALFEYLIQVPANRIGHTQAQLSMAQLKILQEVVSLSVFVPVALFVLREPLRWDYVWAGLCIAAAVFFMFRGKIETSPPSPTPQIALEPATVSQATPDPR